jgi:hypothetical protein
MNSKRLYLMAVALVVISNLGLLGKTAYNRAKPMGQITLSDRELIGQSNYRAERTGVKTLRLQWRTYDPQQSFYSRSLSANEKLITALGFDEQHCSYRHRRPAYVLMELDGEARQMELMLATQRLNDELEQADADRQRYLQDQLNRWQQQETRLYAVAVSKDSQSLQKRVRAPEKQFIVKGTVSANCKEQEVTIHQIALERFHVPSQWYNDPVLQKSFDATIMIGALGDTWIQAIDARD